MSLLDLLANTAKSLVAPDTQDPNAPTQVDGITVTAKKPPAPSGPPPAPSFAQQAPPAPTPGTYNDPVAGEGANTTYNNVPQLHAIQDVAQQYHGPGTLRNILGTLGDAFLIQSGHNPVYGPWQDRQKIANAAAGFDTNPQAAASRIAATGAEGSMGDATNMFNAAETTRAKEAAQQQAQDYHQQIMDDRTQNHQALQAQAQAKADDRTRALNGGILKAAAATGDPKKYAAARAAALARIPEGSSISPDEYPDDLNDFNSGYGLNANQVTRAQNQDATLAQRGQIAQMRNQTAVRGQNVSAGTAQRGQNMANQRSAALYAQKLINKQNSGQPLTSAEQQYWSKITGPGKPGGGGGKLTIPGITPAGGGAGPLSPQQAAKLPSGTRFQGTNGQWYVKH